MVYILWGLNLLIVMPAIPGFMADFLMRNMLTTTPVSCHMDNHKPMARRNNSRLAVATASDRETNSAYNIR